LYDPVDVATCFVATFAARDDVYSAWVPDLAGWRPVREPLTAEVMLAGWAGRGPSISGYMIAPGSVTHVMAVDFDTDDGLEQAFTLARTMRDEAALPAYVETSRRGAHLWCVLDAVVAAKVARRALRAFIASALLPTEDPHIEIRPGSDHVDAEHHQHVTGAVVGTGLGHALRMPFMPHPKTGQRGHMFTSAGLLLNGPLSSKLLELEWASASIVTDWSARWSPQTTRIPKAYHLPADYGPDEYENVSASEVLRTLWAVERAAPGRSVRCPAHDDKVASLSILRDDRRVICKSPSCILNNGDHGRGTFELTRLAPHG
jgi:hypothetical protein